ncbi:anaerobic glycerol-3-phosphate dehydrogenase subunit B [Halosimplex carlsbadense 2-9-1]|uniref:Anaerobic glycerol-3-phosphate dehydrogenase subunit B n=1 Tax=Halosimplex carlsbadense 2-9-1 TaxID=797114 RepID=M0CLU8_9EURY|nr:glycerol-3-phosphate dehydrogenase subunit GlpB [Halosimplex carlsbadense]ELZ24250.1 anaerobic glycerol-3-phosphate dehydrogenase subunit B [Halosimplex carlsbadense 2-9-1]
MAIESEVVVVGGGLAGGFAALAAAREGADTRLLSYKQSTLAQASGLVDVLGYAPDGDGAAADPFEVIPALPDEHPYRTVGVGGVREAMAAFDEVTDRYRGAHTDRNALLPTHGGTVKPTARYPASTAAGVASDERDALLVGFEALVDFDAPHAATHLENAGVPFEVAGATIAFPGGLAADAKVTRYAKLLDEDAPVETATGATRRARNALASAVEPHLDGAERVGFPAVLGDDDPAAVRESLETELGVPVFEVPMGPPSLPGLRLEDDLYAALDAAGVSMETGNPVVGYDGEGGIESVSIDRNGARIPFAADQFVLATGGLVGKGIGSDRERVEEPIFDCHVPHAADRYEWFDTDAFGDHAFARFGLLTDGDLRPLDADGTAEFENLRAAGSVLGGYDFAAEKSGSGVSIATGHAAGAAAAEALR